MQAKVRQMIQDEEQRAQELEQEITVMQGEGPYNLQRGPLALPVPFQQHTQSETHSTHSVAPSPPSCRISGNQLSRRAKSSVSVAPSITLGYQFQGRCLPQIQRQYRPGSVHHELPSCRCIVRRGRRHYGQVLHHRTRRPSLNLVYQVTATVNRVLEGTSRQVPAQFPRISGRHRCTGLVIPLQAAGKGNPSRILQKIPDAQIATAIS
jgi:hypothetical protein